MSPTFGSTEQCVDTFNGLFEVGVYDDAACSYCSVIDLYSDFSY